MTRATVGLVQTAPIRGDVEGNLRRAGDLVRTLDRSVDLLVLPELFASGYLFESAEDLVARAEPRDGPTARWMRALATEIDGCVVGGWPEAGDDGRFYNAALAVGPDGPISAYRKVHLFDRETIDFTPGGRLPDLFEWRGIRYGLMICFDWRFPEIARHLAVAGADALVHPANLVHSPCPRAMRIRALENRVHALTAGRWGSEEATIDGERVVMTFRGGTQAARPDGEFIDLPAEGDAVLVVEIDAAQSRDKRVTPHNDVLGDRRTDLYR